MECSEPQARQQAKEWCFDDVVVRWNGSDWHFNVTATYKPTKYLDYALGEVHVRNWSGPYALVGQDRREVLKKLRCALDDLVWSDGTPKDEACCYSEVF